MSISVTREAILTALFNKLSTVVFASPVKGTTGFVTSSRRIKHWADVAKTERPALFMACHGETTSYKAENSPVYLSLSIKLFIYIDSSDMSSIPDIDISVILDAVHSALSPGSGEQKLTLGGIVSHCRIDGSILRDPGDMDGDGIIVIPVTVSTT